MLCGRGAELEVLSTVLSAPSAGASAALVIRGEPGVGKTALVAHVLRQVMAERPDVTLLTTTAAPTESCLGFGGLLGVLRPVLDGLDALPARQAAALRSAFALGPATEPDRFAVATATLGLLAVAAQRGPLIVFIDDWHWLDPGSAQALAFAARRLGDDAVAFVATVRSGETDAVPLDGLPVLDLAGLDLAGAAEMADGTGDEIEPGVLAELVARTSGNPLALQESIAQLGPLVRRGPAPAARAHVGQRGRRRRAAATRAGASRIGVVGPDRRRVREPGLSLGHRRGRRRRLERGVAHARRTPA